MADMNTVNFNYDKAKRLRLAYNNALDAGKKTKDTFVFDGQEYVLGYAYYMLEHLSNPRQYNDPDLKPKRRAPE